MPRKRMIAFAGGGQGDQASNTKKARGPNRRSSGHFGGRRQLSVTVLVTTPYLV